MIEYTLTLNSDQAREALKAIELLMRLKLGQYQEIVYNLAEINTPEKIKQIDKAEKCFKRGFDIMNEGKPLESYKNYDWYRLYNLYQVIRYNIHNAENPDGTGVDSYPPMQMTEEPLPKCEWRKL